MCRYLVGWNLKQSLKDIVFSLCNNCNWFSIWSKFCSYIQSLTKVIDRMIRTDWIVLGLFQSAFVCFQSTCFHAYQWNEVINLFWHHFHDKFRIFLDLICKSVSKRFRLLLKYSEVLHDIWSGHLPNGKVKRDPCLFIALRLTDNSNKYSTFVCAHSNS